MNENSYPNISVPQTETIIKKEEKEGLLANENSKVKKMLIDFPFFGMLSVLFGVFYCFCLYKNTSGITMPLFMAGAFAYFIICMKKLEISLKRDAWFYIASACLLGISNFLTSSNVLIFFNCVGIILLLLGFLLHHFYEDREWHFGKQTSSLVALFFGTIGSLHYWPKGFSYHHKKKENASGKNSRIKYIFLGVVIAIPLLMVVCVFLMSADVVFREMFERLFQNIVMPDNVIGIGITTLLAIWGSYGMLIWLSKKQLSTECPDRKTLEPLIAITFTSMLTVVYLLFSAIQILYLFLGNMELPDGYTYAGYAREGFFQLLFVCMINLVIVLICVERFKDSVALNIILTVFSVCTYIMIASSAMRMILYIQTYDLTFLRVFVLWSLAVLALLLVGILISIYHKKFLLFRYCMVVVTISYIIFSLAKPDYYIAKYNINKAVKSYHETEEAYEYEYLDRYLDETYLFCNLSLDAAPAIKESDLFPTEETYWIDEYCTKIKRETKDMGVRNFNLSRYKAKQIWKEFKEK